MKKKKRFLSKLSFFKFENENNNKKNLNYFWEMKKIRVYLLSK